MSTKIDEETARSIISEWASAAVKTFNENYNNSNCKDENIISKVIHDEDLNIYTAVVELRCISKLFGNKVLYQLSISEDGSINDIKSIMGSKL
jgi:hypothetical protein